MSTQLLVQTRAARKSRACATNHGASTHQQRCSKGLCYRSGTLGSHTCKPRQVWVVRFCMLGLTAAPRMHPSVQQQYQKITHTHGWFSVVHSLACTLSAIVRCGCPPMKSCRNTTPGTLLLQNPSAPPHETSSLIKHLSPSPPLGAVRASCCGGPRSPVICLQQPSCLAMLPAQCHHACAYFVTPSNLLSLAASLRSSSEMARVMPATLCDKLRQ